MVLPESKRAWVVIFSKLIGTSFRSITGKGAAFPVSHRLILAGIGVGQFRSGSEAMLLMLSLTLWIRFISSGGVSILVVLGENRTILTDDVLVLGGLCVGA